MKPYIPIFAIIIGVLGIFLLGTPHTVCDSQLEVLKETGKGRIFQFEGKKRTLNSKFPKQIENCKLGNSPGSCFELFANMRKVILDLKHLSSECLIPAGEISEVNTSLVETLILLTQIADSIPMEPNAGEKFGWLSKSEEALFCDIKTFLIRAHEAPEFWEEFEQTNLKKIPQFENKAKSQSFEQIRGKSLYSINCPDVF